MLFIFQIPVKVKRGDGKSFTQGMSSRSELSLDLAVEVSADNLNDAQNILEVALREQASSIAARLKP